LFPIFLAILVRFFLSCLYQLEKFNLSNDFCRLGKWADTQVKSRPVLLDARLLYSNLEVKKMGREATKAAGNPWYEARKKAAEYDDRLCSRERAAEQLGMSVSSLADAELGLSKCMPVDKAVLMADRYNAPHLLNYYCLHECPIGHRHSLSEELLNVDRVTIKLLKQLKVEELDGIKDKLLDIAEDGVISEDEKPELEEIIAYLDELAKTISELKTIGRIALNGGK